MNLFYSNVTIDNEEWKDFSEQSELVLWKLLIDKNTAKNARECNNSDQTDRDDDIRGNDKFKERKLYIILMDQHVST